jgi:micrococcal nuclease
MRRYTKKNVDRYVRIAALIIASLAFFALKPLIHSKTQPAASGQYYVKRVVDGDTLALSNGEKVRLIGVDTPEYHHSDKLRKDASRSREDAKTIQAMGKEAYEFTKGLASGRMVRLEFDVEKRDKYGRLLAYVYLDDGTFLNARILESGYGRVMTIPPNVKYADYFLKLQRQARDANKGLWKDAAYKSLAKR